MMGLSLRQMTAVCMSPPAILPELPASGALRGALLLLALLVLPGSAGAQQPADTSSPDPLAPAMQALHGDDLETVTVWAARYEHGEGVPRDIDTAVRLYCAAARKDHAPAAYGLGWLYANGRGVGRDDRLAAAWAARAAQAGDPHAARLLRLLGTPAETGAERCVLADGSEIHGPLFSAPDPQRGLVMQWVQQLAPQAGIDPLLALAIVEVESAFNPRARSPKDARGLMQLIPATARRFAVADIWDPLDNVRGGLAYLGWLREHFDGRVELVLAGYNAGEQAVTRHGGIPPYRETRGYVRRVLEICRAAHAGRWRFDAPRAAQRRVIGPAVAVQSAPRPGHTSCVSEADANT